MKSKSTAGILALFLGGVGIHRFYLGQTGLGILYLLFCWTFIPAIIALVDAILFFSQSTEAFNTRYNSHIVASPCGKERLSGIPINLATELLQLKGLKDQGLLSEQDFEASKAKLLDSI